MTRDRAGRTRCPDDGLLRGLNGCTATALLECVRTEEVCWLAIDADPRGAVASPAEATGWETVASTARRVAYPNAYPNRNPYGCVREHPRPTPRGPDLDRRTQADVGGRASGA